MKILTIYTAGIPSGTGSDLIRANVFQDFDAVIVNPEDFRVLYGDVEYRYSEQNILTTKYGQIIERINERRRNEVHGLLRRGGIVVCFLQPLRIYKYEDVYAGKSIIEEITNYDWLLDYKERINELGDIIFSRGRSIEFIDSNHSFSKYLYTKPSWSAYIEKDTCANWKIIASAFGTHILSLTKRIEMGHIVFLPSEYDYHNGEILEHCIIELHKGQEVTPQPAWAKEILVPGQQKLIVRVDDLNKQISSREKERESIIGKNQELDRWKYLLYEKGKHQLEPVIREALSLIGCTVKPQPDKDSNGLVSSECETALIEATGSKGTVKIEKLGELTTNMGNYMSQRREEVKGILVGNPFCEEPLDNRPPQNSQKLLFAKELIDSAKNQGITVLLTTELYKVISRILSGEITTDQVKSIRDKIFKGRGLVYLIE